MPRLAVWWVKRDARLADNACLAEAEKLGLPIVPFFCFEPELMAQDDSSLMHHDAQRQAVLGLRAGLREHQADMVIAQGSICEKLTKLLQQVPFSHLFCHEEVGNGWTFSRDRAVTAWCQQKGIHYQEFPQSSVRRTGVNRDRLKQMWQMRIVNQLPYTVPVLRQPPELRQWAATTSLPRLPTGNPEWQPVSEVDAQATLQDFLHRRGIGYRGGISSPNTAMTAGSRLSVHLAWGTISTRQIWHAVRQRLTELDPDHPKTGTWKRSLEAFLSRLHWRDHFTQRLESEPELEYRSIHPAYREIPYENDPRLLEAWQQGLTGYPMVDAVMRCLAATGFVNFRMRAMVTSFACHVLHLDWRQIHPHLARVFRDYDPGIHLSQLQMQAGVVGWNAIRVYNPTKQLQDWDPECRFVKAWIPELRRATPEAILTGNLASAYPPQIVPFAERAKSMTDHLYAIRKSAEAQAATPAVYFKHGSRKKETRFRPRRTKPKAKPATPPAQRTLLDWLDENQ
jgi:deoxyribodipyrimidine photo-lyase